MPRLNSTRADTPAPAFADDAEDSAVIVVDSNGTESTQAPKNGEFNVDDFDDRASWPMDDVEETDIAMDADSESESILSVDFSAEQVNDPDAAAEDYSYVEQDDIPMDGEAGSEVDTSRDSSADDFEEQAPWILGGSRAQPIVVGMDEGSDSEGDSTDTRAFADDEADPAARDAQEIDVDLLEYDESESSSNGSWTPSDQLRIMTELDKLFPPAEGQKTISTDENVGGDGAEGQAKSANEPSSSGMLRTGKLSSYIFADCPVEEVDGPQALLHFKAFDEEAEFMVNLDDFSCSRLNIDVYRANGSIDRTRYHVGDQCLEVFVDVRDIHHINDVKSISAYLAREGDVIEALIMSYVFEESKHEEAKQTRSVRPWEL